ncbi:MAG: outer membrane protein assembly factor BamA [Thermodesulfovibrionales bacterium]
MGKVCHSVASFLLLLTALFFTTGLSDVLADQSPIVTSIEIKGLKRIEEGSIKSKITQKSGEPISNEKVADDIKNIYKMGYFDDVTAEMEPQEGGIKLIYVVKEKPTIIKLDFQGNKELEDAKLKEKIAVTVGSIADTTLIQDNAQKLQLFYEDEGYWLAKIVPVVNKIGENEVSLTYQIEEGRKVRIKKIIIKGNKVMSSSKIKKVMKTSEWGMFSFISSSGYYKRETMTADLESIKDLYFNNGYIKASVANPEITISDDKNGMTITMEVFEGDQYKISSVGLTGNKVYSEADLRKKIMSAPGAVFSKETLKKDIAGMTDLYTQHGYALANVFPDLVPDEATKTVSLTYKIEEGYIYHIGRIEITGNVKTKDKVIRREIRLDEGDEFNSALLKRSYERLNNLNFFESVDLSPKPRYEEKLLDIDAKVKEKSTGFISVGGGYSSVDKLIGMAEITQGNLFGNGQTVKVKGELGGRSSYYELSFKDPWFMDKPIAFNAEIYYNTRRYIDYEKIAEGLGFGFGKSFGEYWSSNIAYNFEIPTIYGVQLASADEIIKEQIGKQTTSSITPSLTRDSRDNFLDPSSGSRNSIYVTVAGFGGSNAFIKGVADSAWFFPFGKTAFMVRGRVGYGLGILDKEFPLYERFYVGGIYTVRGLSFGDAGPKGSLGENIGGVKELIFNNEYIFPIVSELRLKGVVFVDAGNAYDAGQPFGTLRYTSGTGFRWISPMGPIRVEWGYNIQRKPGEPASKVEFAFGSFF